MKFLAAIPMLMTLIACGSKESVEITANTSIPVRPHSITQSLLNLMNIAPVGECYQDQIYLALHDIQADKFVAAKKVKLRTSLISAVPLHTPSYINSGSDIDEVIYRLVHNSFLDEPLTMLVPKDRPFEIALIGNFSKPVDANDDGICDQINLIQAPSYLISDDQSLSSPRTRHAAINLPNGKILVAGGINNSLALNTAEVYDPISRTWGATDNVISAARAEATASVIKPGIYAGTNAGKVLLVGGVTATGTSVAATELYTPSSNSWQITLNPSPDPARRGHTATALNDGRVLIAGGIASSTPLNSTSIYNPSIAAWTTAGTMNQSRSGHTATLMKGGTYDGQVFIIGGVNSVIIERFNPSNNTWVPITPTGTFVARYAHTATLLPDGRILVAGGKNYAPSPITIGNVDIFDPSTNTWNNQATISPTMEHTASLLPDGRVLIAGGSSGSMSLNSLLLSNFNYTAFNVSATLNHNRTLHTTNSLPDGSIIFSGGIAFSVSLDSVEHLQLVKPALNSSSFMGHTFVSQNAIAAGSIDLRIDVLHSNFNATALDYSSFISINPNKFKDWVELPDSEFSTFPTAGGTSTLESVSLLKDNVSAPMINMKLVHGPFMTNYVPHLFPLVLEFNYLGTTAGACSNALPYCSGRYRAVIFNSDPVGTSLVATLIPGTGSTGSTPPATINSNSTYHFRIKTF